MNINYDPSKKRAAFWSPYDSLSGNLLARDYIGQPFEIVAVLKDAEENSDGGTSDMYRVRFPNGQETDAFGEEVFEGEIT